MLHQVEGGLDTFSLWQSYLRRNTAPDVLVIGDSRVRADIDAGAIGKSLSRQRGQNITAEKFGISGGQPSVLDGLLYRVLKRPSRPKVLVYALSEYSFNASYISDPTSDFWQMSDPPDVGFMRRAIRLDPKPLRLVEGWVMPVFEHAPVLSQPIECRVRPLEQATPCANPSTLPRLTMTPASRDYVLSFYANIYLRNYVFSRQQAQYVRDAAQLAASAAVKTCFVILPVLGIDAIDPSSYTLFLSRMRSMANSLGAPLVDFHRELTGRPDLWTDPSHLNARGAAVFADSFAKKTCPALEQYGSTPVQG